MNNLKFLRSQANLTTRELGGDVGLSCATITQIEKGNQKITEKNLESLSRFFDVKKSYLLGETDEGIFVYDNLDSREPSMCILTTEGYKKAKDEGKIIETIERGKYGELYLERQFKEKYVNPNSWLPRGDKGELVASISKLTDEQAKQVLKFINNYILSDEDK